jgi:hypothetical protein
MKYYRAPLYNMAGYGFFGDVFRSMIPLITQKVAPYLGRKLVETGKDVMEDIQEGRPFKAAVKRRFKKTFEESKQDLLRKMSGKGYKRRRVTQDVFTKHGALRPTQL